MASRLNPRTTREPRAKRLPMTWSRGCAAVTKGIRFLHAADLHLGSPFKGLAADGDLPPRFTDCTFRAFDRLIALAIAQRVDAVLLVGDLYDQRDRSLRAG